MNADKQDKKMFCCLKKENRTQISADFQDFIFNCLKKTKNSGDGWQSEYI